MDGDENRHLLWRSALPGTKANWGAKPPLRPKHVWSRRTKLQVEGRLRPGAVVD
jgi:hypothetical protein